MAGFGLALVLMLLIAFVAHRSIVGLVERVRSVDHSHLVLEASEEAFSQLHVAVSSQRAYLLTADDSLLAPYERAVEKLAEELARLRSLTADNPQQQRHLERLAPLIAERMAILREGIEDRRRTPAPQAFPDRELVVRGESLTVRARALLAEVQGDEEVLLRQREVESQEGTKLAIAVVLIGSAASAAMLLAAFGLLRREIGQRLRAEAALRRHAEEIEDLYQKAPCGYHSLDADGRIVRINDTGLAWLGYTREEVEGKMRFSDLCLPASAKTFVRHFPVFKTTGAVSGLDFDLRHKNGTMLSVSLSATVIRDADGEYIASRSTLFDVSERKRAERERDRIFELSHDLICVADASGHFRRVNPSWERTLGFTIEELQAAPFLDFVHPDDRAATTTVFEDLIARGLRVVSFENRYRCKDGSYRVLLWNATPVPGEGLIYSSAHDITERKLALQEMDAQAKALGDLKAALDMHSIVAITDSKGKITFVNDKFCAISKYSREELVGQDHRIINSGFHPKEFIRDIWRTIGQGRSWKGEIKNRAKDGSLYWVDTTIVPFLKPDGKPFQYVAIRTDITERKRSEDALRVAKLVAEATNKELEAFSYSVSHDLRAPLRAIDGFSHAVLDDYGHVLDDAGKRHLEKVRNAAQRMSGLIEDLLKLSRISRMQLKREHVDLGALAAQVIERLRSAEPVRQVVVVIADGLEASGDAGLLRILLENLLGNAWKYTGKRESAKIEVGRAVVDGQAAWFVRDNGAGFDMAYADKLFGAFQRLHRPEEFEGTGVGLATAQRIVRLHGGRIYAESVVDEGATFYFSLGPEGGSKR